MTWRRSVDAWRDYILDKEGVRSVFQSESGKRAVGSKPHRFDPEYADKQYAKLKDLERGLSEDYGKRLHTAMLTFTASATPDGEPLPPVDHLDELNSSWEAIRRSLARQLEGRRWEYLAILEPHPGGGDNNGYLHIHMAVFVDGKVTREAFKPSIQAHLRNCEYAGQEAHDVTDETTISVRHAGADRDRDDDDSLDELAIYLAEYLGTYGDDPLDLPEHVQAANAVLWATGRQRWRPSNGAQTYMKTPEHPDDDGEEWELIAIQRDGEEIEVDPAHGGVDRFVTSSLDPPDRSGVPAD